MNVLTDEIYAEFHLAAQACRDQLLAVHDEIIKKIELCAEDPSAYPRHQRVTDSRAFYEAIDQLSLAIDSILAIDIDEEMV